MHSFPKKILALILCLTVYAGSVSVAQTELFYAKKIGSTATGFASYDCDANQFELISQASSISGSSDSFNFIYRELTNDLDIKAQVNSNTASLTGLMIRSGNGENMPFSMVGLSGGKTITRYRTGSSINTISGNEAAATTWLRIRREGNAVSSYYSIDGSAWDLIETRNVAMGAAVNVGMVGVNGTVQYNQVEIVGTLEPVEVVDPGPSLPASRDSIAVNPDNGDSGDLTYSEPDPWSNPDVYLATPKNLTSKVVSDYEMNLYWVDASKNETGFSIERKAGDGNFEQVAVVPPSAEGFQDKKLKPLTRYTYRILAFSQYVSSEYSNEAWNITPDGPGAPEPEPADTGDGGSEISVPPPPAPIVSTPPADPVVPAPPTETFQEVFSVQNIGTEMQAASSSYDEDKDMFRLSASGGQVWGTEDDFRYVYREISGDVEATVKVSSLVAGDEFGKAGIMFRESTGQDVRHAFLTISAGNSVALERRHNVGEGTTRSGKGNVSTPIWLRLLKEGNYISAYFSEDGDNWSFLSEDIIEFPDSISIGLAVAAQGENESVTADFGELQIVELQTESATETFISADIGKVGVNGDAAYDSGADTFLIEASGGDIGDVKDAFHYVFREVTGDFESTARIDSLVAEEDWAKAGLMIRESFQPDSPYYALFMAKSVGIVHQLRSSVGGGSDWSKVDNVVTPFWVKLSRTGNVYRAYYSMDGTAWTLMNEATINLSNTLLVGMALTSHKEGALAYAEFSNLSVTD